MSDHVAVVQSEEFDGQAFIQALPDRLETGYIPQENDIEVDFPMVSLLATEHGGTLLSVRAQSKDGEKFVEIYAYSRCGEDPATP